MAADYGGVVNLPPGFRFGPTDEELILHFLLPKARRLPCYPDIIPNLDLSMHDPWQLQGKALWSEKQFYFFSRVKENIWVTETGIWKEEEEAEQPIFSGGEEVGFKKLFVFCFGDDPEAQTSWFMQQYFLSHSSIFNPGIRRSHKQNLGYCKWTLCRVEERKGRLYQNLSYNDEEEDESQLSCLDEMYLEFDDDSDVTSPN